MIEIKSVTKKYGDYTAIENINLTVNDSSVLGLAGFNGSGKTTLLNVCAGVFKADSGAVYLDG
ncbi:MAG: ATP-binding cassette domain-containing protein, partial [Clostridia bacterium]|nr:ATP-binding cassette domain-containing protein [Clostridia bacterium]